MAYVRTSYFDCTSQANIKYRVEFYDQGQVYPTDINQERQGGPNPVSIKYGSDGSKMFAPFKPSTLTINMMVTSPQMNRYINAIRTDRQERDVYVAVYRENLTGNQNPQYGPLWGGYILMDLSDEPDITLPWNKGRRWNSIT